jgi:hypothetical protein
VGIITGRFITTGDRETSRRWKRPGRPTISVLAFRTKKRYEKAPFQDGDDLLRPMKGMIHEACYGNGSGGFSPGGSKPGGRKKD